jgi:PAS domain S-box-containing protein
MSDPKPDDWFSEDPEAGFRLLVESVREYAIFRLDPKGFIVTWNSGAERLKRYRASEILGKHFSIFYPREEAESGKCERELEIALATGKYEEEGWRIRQDGTRFWANVVITPLFEGDRHVGFGKVTRDMTERRRNEEQLRQARSEAEHANQAKTEFLSRVSHELRTPLTAILGFAELLQAEGPRKDQENRLSAILNAGDHLLNLINDVLEISRIEAGRDDIHISAVPLGPLVGETVGLMQPLARSRDISISSDVAPDLMVEADAQRLSQVLLNIVSNAIKYNRDKGTVDVSATRAGDRVTVRVSDTGMGIEESMLPRVFEPFDRLGAERLNISGTGLGLALSKRLVESMQGRISLTSEPGVGTTFVVEIPAAEQALVEPVDEAPSGTRSAGAAAAAATATVLYIEDNLANVELVQGMLGQRPEIQILTAMQGQLGLDMARQARPDLILLDLHLPDLTGEHVLQALKADPETRAIPVIMLTADALPEQRRAFLEAGAVEYLTKPVRLATLLDAIDTHIAHPPASAPPRPVP